MLNLTKSLSTPLFGTDGIRGKVGELLTTSLAREIGFWTAQVLQQQTHKQGVIIIGQDSRNSSDMLASAIASGINAAGGEVWHLGLCPTPCVSYLTNKTEAIGGIMVSASHNPPEDNGIKIFNRNGLKLAKTFTQEIEKGLRSDKTVKQGLTTLQASRHHLVQNYLEGVLASLPPQSSFSGLRIVLDLAWGAAVELAPQAFRNLGAEVICINAQANGDRINVNCGSTHLNPLKQAVKEYRADLGFAFDGDADRVIAIDSLGNIVDGDHILYFWGKYLQQQQKLPDNMIVATVMANLGFEMAWRNCGGKMIRTAVGDQYVQAQMWESGAMLGGEQSGHILCHHHSFSGDGLQTALHLSALIHNWGTCLRDLRQDSFQSYPQFLRNVRVNNREILSQWQNHSKITTAIALAETSMGKEGRVLIRASGTEPVIRVMVEASNTDIASYWTNHLVSVVQQELGVA